MSSATDILIEDPNAESQKQSGFLTGLARAVGSFYTKKTLGAVGLTIILLLVVVAVFAPLISRYDPSFTFQSENPNYKTNPSISFSFIICCRIFIFIINRKNRFFCKIFFIIP